MGVAKPLKKIKKNKLKNKVIDFDKLIKKSHHKIDLEFLHTPIKSPACKQCPALDKGICKCARKRLKH